MKFYAEGHSHDANLSFFDDEVGNFIHIEYERFNRRKHTDSYQIFEKEERKKVLGTDEYDVKGRLIQKFTYKKIDLNHYEYLNRDFSHDKYTIKNNKRYYMLSHHLAHASYAYYTRPDYMKNCDIL